MPFSHTLVLKTYVADTLMSLFAFGQKPVTEYFLSIKILLSLILGMAVPVFTGEEHTARQSMKDVRQFA